MVIAAEWNALGRSYGMDAAAEWQLVLRQFEFGEGFALLVVTVPDRFGAELCRGELEAYLRPDGKHCRFGGLGSDRRTRPADSSARPLG